MKIYVKKYDENRFVVLKESTKESIVSDLFTILVLIILVGLDIVFSILVVHSYVLDVFVIFMIVWYFSSQSKGRKEIYTKSELIELIEKT